MLWFSNEVYTHLLDFLLCIFLMSRAAKEAKSVKRKVLWTCKNAPIFTLELHFCWFLDPSGPPFWTKLGYVEIDILGFPFESKQKTIRKSWTVDLGHSWRSSRNVNLTDLLPKLGPNKHDFVNENWVQKTHLGWQGSIQSDLVGQAISSARMLFSTRWTSWNVIWSGRGRSRAIWSGTCLDRWTVFVTISRLQKLI